MLPLKVILGHDLLPWEREMFSGIISALSAHFQVHTTDLVEDALAMRNKKTAVWYVSRAWKDAIRKLKEWPEKNPALVTVLDTTPASSSWHSLLWEKWETPPANQRFLCLSPFTFRFLSEIKGLTKSQLHFIPLPFPLDGREQRQTTSGLIRPKLRVGTFSKFTSENNLHHIVTVAHYVAQKSPNVQFTVMGYGPLTKHLRGLIASLGLEKNVLIRETTHVEEINGLDLFLYIPVRNDHFGPLLYAAQYGLPVIANELPGVEDLILEGRTGFITPPHDTKSLGELILRMESRPELQTGMGMALKTHLKRQFPSNLTAESIARIFHGFWGMTSGSKAEPLAS